MTYPNHIIFGSMNMNGSPYQQDQQGQQDQFQTEPMIFNQYQPNQAQQGVQYSHIIWNGKNLYKR